MDLNERIDAFVQLGEFLRQFPNDRIDESCAVLNQRFYVGFEEVINNEAIHNPWFIKPFVLKALLGISLWLTKSNLNNWVLNYNFQNQNSDKVIGIVMAGNIPLVGFHDFLSVIISGNICLIKSSSKDSRLINFISEVLFFIQPQFRNYISFTEGSLKNYDAVIATGSSNTARYFEQYFGRVPNIIRKSRTSLAVLNGLESSTDLSLLVDDMLMYFGLGCRNVSKLWVPPEFEIISIYKSCERYAFLNDNHKFMNNYEYNRAIYLIDQRPHFDNGYVILKEDSLTFSPVGVIYFQVYNDLCEVEKDLVLNENQIQCVVSTFYPDAVKPGQAQYPTLQDYADNIDTMEFLSNLK